MFRKLSIIILSFLSGVVLFAQSSIRVEAPNLVAVSEQFNVTFIIEGDDSPSDFQWSTNEDFRLVWGPQRGRSTSTSFINGKRTRSSQTTFTYVLMPRRTGKFQLPQASATIKGRQIVSARPSIEVVSDGQGNAQQQPQASAPSNPSYGEVSSDDIFMRLSLSKDRAVVGEPINATLKLYQRVNISGFEDAHFPTFNGFWSQEVQAPTNIEFHRENVGNMIYNAAVIRSWIIIPQQSGDLAIDPAELVCLVNVRAPMSSGGSFFDNFFMDDYRTIRKRVSTRPVTVHVRPLPAGAPSSFGGGVGNFRISATLTKDSLKTHEAASLKVTVSGKGNVSLLEAPKVKFPPDFETYDIKSETNSDRKSFEYPFIPRSHGDFVIGPVEYSYYDPSAGKYVTIRTEALPISVERGAEVVSSGEGQLVSTPGRRDVRDLGTDIRYISRDIPAFSGQGRFFAGSPLFWVLTALVLLLGALAYFVLRTVLSRRSDVAFTRNRSATKMARKRLSTASEFLQKDLYTAFYEELHKTLLGFISDKLNMDAAEMSKDNIRAKLVEASVQEGVADDFIALLDACEYARYAPSSGHDQMNTHYESAVKAISLIDESMKRSGRGAGALLALTALLLCLQPAVSNAQTDHEYLDSLWNQAVASYGDGHWTQAAAAWQSIDDLGIQSPELYYNLGNAYFKSEDYAHAILYYERALKLDPSYSDARYNLEFSRQFVQDRIDSVPEFFVKTWARKVCQWMPSNAWAALFLLLLALSVVMCVVFLLSHRPALRKTGFFVALASLLLALVCIANAAWQKSDYLNADDAIVMRAVTSVKSSPGSESAKDLFILHEGTKVKVLDEVGGWNNIELSDGRQGWISSSDIELI